MANEAAGIMSDATMEEAGRDRGLPLGLPTNPKTLIMCARGVVLGRGTLATTWAATPAGVGEA